MLKELLSASAIIAACGYLLTEAMKLPKPRFEPLGPSFFPSLILSTIIVLSLVNIAAVLWRARRARSAMATPAPSLEGATTTDAADDAQTGFGQTLPVISALAFALYVLVVAATDIPFWLVTFVFIALLCWIMSGLRRDKIIVSMLVAAALVALEQWVFVDALGLVLP